MSQINIRTYFSRIAAVTVLVLAIGCGSSDRNERSLDADSGTHSEAWRVPVHSSAYLSDQASCAECHGAQLQGASGPACSSCHMNGAPLTATNCTSCHGSPPSGFTAPNRKGAHGPHYALPGVSTLCDSCHAGAGRGKLKHADGNVDLAFASAYNAKSAAAVYNADGTCSNVSCHGAITTPVWLSGGIDVNTQCTACHTSGTTQYNSYNSGKHNFHIVLSISCTTCHDTTNLAVNHFTHLETTAMEGPASETMKSLMNYRGGSCSPFCHTRRDWN